ncbi:MAG: DNA circularization N-terminal domain-containing protein [Treponemataceae bacterium]
MEKWKPDLSAPISDNWRIAYGAKEINKTYKFDDDIAQTSYQAPNGSAIAFIYENMKLSGGLSVSTSEYPFFGDWSSIPLNEKTQSISVSGFLRGNEYIKNRNALIDALRVVTSDDEPGYITLPLWGRFPVIVIDWDVEEVAKELGQCKINLTFTRAGVPLEKRWQFEGTIGKTISEAAETLKDVACDVFAKKLSSVDDTTFVNSFSLIQKALIAITGRIQASNKMLNNITNSISQISNLISQGIRSPKTFALTLFSAVGKIVSSIAEVKNAIDENIAFFRIKNNEKNILFPFLANYKISLPLDAVTIPQERTKTASEELYKTVSLFAVALILPKIENQTYEKTNKLFDLYTRLEKSIDLNNPTLYFAVNELRSAVSKSLAEKNLNQEFSINLNSAMPILALAKYLGCEENVIRELNRIEDSFVVQDEVRYV